MSFKLENSFRKNILQMSGYVGGEQLDKSFIRLNTNENPYPIPQIIKKAIIDELDKNELALYPDESSSEARKVGANFFKIKPEQIIFDNGSASLLSLIFRAVLDSGDSIAVATPTFTLYNELAKLQNATLIEINFLDNYKLPVKSLLETDAKMIIIVNPNAPTGTEIDFKDIEEVISKSNRLVLLDEAYADFSKRNGINLLEKYDNLIILKTFSKYQALAGLRVGIALSSIAIINELNKVRATYNMNRLTQTAIKSVFKNWELFAQTNEKIIKEREKTYKKLLKRNFIVPKSETNFLFVEIPKNFKLTAKDYYEKLKSKKILVRYFGEKLDNIEPLANSSITK